MRPITLSLLTILTGSGCIYDNNCPDRQKGPGSSLDTGSDAGIDSPEYFLSPDVATAGETVILSLQSDPAVDYLTIEDISFLEDISVCTMSAREDELLLTVSVDDLVLPGAIDLIIEHEDGSHVFIEAGFTVLDPDADEPTGESGSDDEEPGDGSADGSGDEPDGSGSEGPDDSSEPETEDNGSGSGSGCG